MKNVIVVTQEENWEDDAGSHDPCLAAVSDEDFDKLLEFDERGDTLTHDEYEQVEAMLYSSDVDTPVLPCMLDGVFSFWYSYK